MEFCPIEDSNGCVFLTGRYPKISLKYVRFINLYLLLIFFHSPPIFASDQWMICKRSSECVVDEDACYGPIAILFNFITQNKDRNEKQRPEIFCEEYKGPHKDNYFAVCKKKKCVLQLK